MSSTPQEEKGRQDIDANRDVAAFSYFLILSPVILFTRKDSPFIQFHARQACVLFVLLIIIAQFPQPISFLNFLILALAITGIFQANLGNRWRVPFIAQIIEAGFSVDSIWRCVVRSFDTFRRSFVRADHLPPLKKETKQVFSQANSGDLLPLKIMIAKEQAARDAQESRLHELEKAFIKFRFLVGKPENELPEDSRKKLEEFIRKLSPLYYEHHEKTDVEAVRLFIGKREMPELMLGGLREDSFKLFLMAPLDHADLKFGEYSGKTLKFDDEKAQERVIGDLNKLAKNPDFKIVPDSPENAPE